MDTVATAAAEDEDSGLPKWLDELLKPGVSQGVFTTLKVCLVGLVLTLCMMLAVLEDATIRMHVSIFLIMSLVLLALVIWFFGELAQAMAEQKAAEGAPASAAAKKDD